MPKKQTKKEVYVDDSDQYEVELIRPSDLILKDKIASQCVKQFEAGLKYKEKRMDKWTQIEAQYNLECTPQTELPEGRTDYPLPIISGFIDSLHAKVDDEPYLEFDHLTLADKKRAKKAGSAWRYYASQEQADWAGEDRAGKKMALMTGRAIFITYCESDPEFKHYFELVDSYDYVAEAMAGGQIKKHRCGFMDNIFRTKYEIDANRAYDKAQIDKLSSACTDEGYKKNNILHRQKVNRLVSIGLKPEAILDYAGDSIYRLTQGFTTYEGVMYWVVMDMTTGIWLRCDPIKEVFESGRHPFVSWAPHFDKFNFWSKAPVENVLPISYASKDLFNEALYGNKKRTSGQRAFDPEVFTDPKKLEWRPEGLIEANVEPGKSIDSGIYEFRTEDNTQITVNMLQFLDNFTGQKTGNTPSAQGQSDKDVKVGVYYGDLQQVADRIGLTNKEYVACWREAGELFLWGIWEHFPPKLMIKVMGEEGVDWEELRKEDVEPDFAVIPKSNKAEIEANELKKKRRDESINAIMLDPLSAQLVNRQVMIKHMLRSAGWEEDDIRAMLDTSALGDEESMINASQAIQDILEGKQPRVYRKAKLGFLQKIKDFVDEEELDLKQEKAFASYFEIMTPIVADNMARLAMSMPMQQMGMQAPMPQNNNQVNNTNGQTI